MSEKARILFVDDDINILNGIKRSLFSLRNEWDMHFCVDSVEAIQRIADDFYDVIVTDLKMPGLDGVALLERVYIISPGTARIILSGHVGEKEITDSITLSHRFLAKPCKKEELIRTIRSAIASCEKTAGPEDCKTSVTANHSMCARSLEKLIGPLKSLPVIPEIYNSLMELLQDENVQCSQVASLLEKDPGISTHILRIANSSYFSQQKKINSLTQAISLIGLRRIRSLVIGLNICDTLTAVTGNSIFINSCWAYSLAVGQTARLILEKEGASQLLQDRAFLGGILHNVGKVVLYMEQPEFYDQVRSTATLLEEEEIKFGFNHLQVGAALVSLWGLPEGIAEIINNYCLPDKIMGFGPLLAVHVSTKLLATGEELQKETFIREVQLLLESHNLDKKLPLWLELIEIPKRP